jgi:Zn-dependent M32 family carboxypeptidase
VPDLTDAQLDQLITDIGLKRPRGGSPRKPTAHGELRGARQHRYRKEPLCEACHRAEAAYQRDKYKASGKPRRRKKAAQAQYLTEEQWQAKVAARSAAKAGGEVK